MEQTYPGEQDFIDHFYAMLPAFKDKRYVKVNGKLLFVIYNPLDKPILKQFLDTWQKTGKRKWFGGLLFCR